MTRVLIAIPTNGHGGCEYNALTFGADLGERFQCEVYATFPLNSELQYVAMLGVNNGLNYVPLACSFEKSDTPESVRLQERTLWRVLDEVQPDVVFIPLPWPKRGQGLISACSAVGVPALVKFALVPETWSDKDFVHTGARRALNNEQIWFANSAYSASLLEKHFGLMDHSVDHFHVGPIGLRRLTRYKDVSPKYPPDQMTRAARLGISDLRETDTVISTVARLTEQKGYIYLLDAATSLASKYEGLRFVWVGDGELRAKLEAEIAARGLTDNVFLLGFRTDVREILRESDLFVLPTVYEGGCSQSLLEAMEESVPAIVSNTSAVGEVVINGVNGLLVDRCNSADLERQIELVLSNPDLRKKLACAARKTVEAYSAEAMFYNTRHRLERLLENEIPERSGPRVAPIVNNVFLENVGFEGIVDFSRSKYLYGLESELNKSGVYSVKVSRMSAFHCYSPDLANSKNIFLSGSIASPGNGSPRLTIKINQTELNTRFMMDGKAWRAIADIPPAVVANPEQGLLFSLAFDAGEQESGNDPTSSLRIRKIAFRFRNASRAVSVSE